MKPGHEQDIGVPSAVDLGLSILNVKKLAADLLRELEGIRQSSDVDLERGVSIRDEVLRYEIDLIRRALRLTGNHQRRAAEVLGVNATTLNAKIKRYNIEP